MATERGTRKLAAIMFTDIKSFSKKMAESEELAMQLLRIHDDTLKATIEKYDGKIIKAIGDAFMVDFSSAVNAVKCAIESQEQFYAYNRGKTELEKLEVRIGIHLGDVITDGNDIFGDGVNIAARIEAVTEPNRICISQDVFSQVKNKMQVGTFHVGSISLKNIPEPVEVYEILIETIPEFAVPSKTAQQMPTNRTAEKATKREAKEAEKVEAAKKKTEDDRQKTEHETEEKVQKLYETAEKLLKQGKLDQAERELNEIFKFVAFHASAQVLQSKIEEERQRKAEEERKKSVSLRKVRQQVGEYMEEALKMVADGNFEEAKMKIREIYKTDPENEDAKGLELRIQEGEKTKKETSPAEKTPTPSAPVETAPQPQEEPEERLQAQETQVVESQVAQPAQTPVVQAPQRRSVGLKPGKKGIPSIVRNLVLVLILGGVAYVLFPALLKVLFPKDTTIIVVPFSVDGVDVDTSGIGDGLADILADDLSRYKELVVIRPGDTDGRKFDSRQLAREVQAHYTLSGVISSLSPTLSVNLVLTAGENSAVVGEWSADSDPYALTKLRSASVANVLQKMGVEAEAKELLPVPNRDIMERFLYARRLTSRFNRESVLNGIELLRELALVDSSVPVVYTTLGKALLREYKIEGERDKTLLKDAVDAALKARSLISNLPAAYEVLGSAYRAAGRYSLAEKTIAQTLEFQPGNAECFRQSSLLSIMEGDYDGAFENASKALLLDPRNPDSQEIIGHAYYFKEQLASAEKSYDRAVALGASPYWTTTRYKIALWGAGLSPEPVAQYCNRFLREDTTNYVLKYWVGRAYMISGIWTEAKKYLEPGAGTLKRILSRNPDDIAAHSYLALFYARLGESANGAEEADKAVELSNGSALTYYRKAQFLAIQTGKKTEALTWLRKAVREEYILWEVMSPDFAFIAKDADFKRAITVAPNDSGENP